MVLARRLLAASIFVAFLVGGWYFASRNSVAVVVHHPGGEIGEFKLWVALAASFTLGVLVAGLVGLYRGARIRMVSRRYRKLVDGLQAEVHQLRSLPLAAPDASSSGAPVTGSAVAGALERGS